MKILHIISSSGMYGAESVILNLSRLLNRRGHHSILGVFSNSANPNLQLHEGALAEGVESHLISCRGQIDRTVPASIRNLASATGAHVVHAHGYKADVYAWFGMRRTPTALVSTCHNWIDSNATVRLYGILDRRALRHYNAVVAVSQQVEATLVASGVPQSRISRIQNGIDLEPFQNALPSLRGHASSPQAPLVGWVGRLSSEKGPDIFIRAAALVLPRFPETRFLLVGDGPDRPSLEALIQQLGVGDAIQLVGRRTDIPAVFASFDLMVSSSRREGLPMAILEGMASGLPWVATSVGDVPTVVRQGETGLVVQPEDVDGLANALARLLGSPEERARMGVAAQNLVETSFSAQKMSSEYLAVYAAAQTKIA